MEELKNNNNKKGREHSILFLADTTFLKSMQPERQKKNFSDLSIIFYMLENIVILVSAKVMLRRFN